MNQNYREFYETGLTAEQQFASKLQGPTMANEKQNMYEHWDVMDARGRKYDVKAMKRFRRSDASATDRIHFLEFRNVHGQVGWLYGEASAIVFETRSHWIVVNRQELVQYAEKSVDWDAPRADKPKVYELYGRSGRNDLMTVVPTVDLLAISEQVVKK